MASSSSVIAAFRCGCRTRATACRDRRIPVRRPAARRARGGSGARRLARELREVVRGRFAFHGGIGGDDQFLHLAFGEARGELVEAELARADAVERD